MVVVTGPRDLTLGGFAGVAYGGEVVSVARSRTGVAVPRTRRGAPPPLPSLQHLDEPLARGVVFACLAELLAPGVPAHLAPAVAALLDRPLPKVAVDGQVGPDESRPLRELLVGAVAAVGGEERHWLLAGCPCAAAMVADAAVRGEQRWAQAVALAALAVEGYRAPLGAYDPALAGLWGDPHEGRTLEALGHWLGGATEEARRAYQAPVSYRILPRVLGQVGRAVDAARAAAETLLPATGTAGVVPAAWRALDAMAVAWAELAFVAERLVTATNLSDELPTNLAVEGGPPLGTYAYGWAASAFTEEARAAALPTALTVGADAGVASGGDLLLPTFPAHRRQRRAAECADGALAILALVASQALFATGRRPAPGLEPVLAAVRSRYPPIDEHAADRVLADDAAALQRAISGGELLDLEIPAS